MCVTAGSSMRCSGYRTSMRLRAIRWSERVGKGLSSKTCSRPRRKEQWQASIAPRRGLKSTWRSEEHTSELQSLMRNSYAVLCLKKKKKAHTSNSCKSKAPRKDHNTHSRSYNQCQNNKE